MRNATRRQFLGFSLAAVAPWLAPIRALAAAVKPVKIRDVHVFGITLPVTSEERRANVYHHYLVVRIDTDAGIRGYSFAGPSPAALPRIKKLLVGQDLFAIERHLKHGLLEWGGVEHALWDAIGKLAGQPVHRLLGGSARSVKAYITCVWPGNPDQSQVSYDEQARMAVKLKQAGFKGMKIRAWRPEPLADVEACGVIKEAVGPGFQLMFDRTAHAPKQAGQKVWDYATGLKVARGLQEKGALWLEEPFARDDYLSPARLAAEVDLLITGGEGFRGLDSFRECVIHKTYDILQPEGRGSGGIFTCRQVGTLAEAFHLPCILHGTMGLQLAGWLQATLAIGAPWQELALITPPLLPQEQWAPASKVLKSGDLFTIRDGMIMAPEYPGLGLDLDEEAIERYRIRK